MHILAAEVGAHSSGDIVGSDDGGTTWTARQSFPLLGYLPRDIAFDPNDARVAWAAWGRGGVWRSADGGRAWHLVPLDGLVTQRESDTSVYYYADVLQRASVEAISADPLSGRLYARVALDLQYADQGQRGAIYAISPQGHVDRFAPSADRIISNWPDWHSSFPDFTVTRDGEMFTWCGGTCNVAPSMTISPVIGAGNWGVSSVFSTTAAAWAQHVLGHPLSPTTPAQGRSAQDFDKGAIAVDGRGGFTVLPLVTQLMAAKVTRPVGGNRSTVTYATLQTLHNRRTPMPPGFTGGTTHVRGGMFVPASPTLAPMSGYIVPDFFWTYLTGRNTSPHGWLKDVGLPVTQAVRATVLKGRLGQRTITLQAFQNSVLTYDPSNPASFQIERANVGADYAATFPQAVR
jgi:hypothetical protein